MHRQENIRTLSYCSTTFIYFQDLSYFLFLAVWSVTNEFSNFLFRHLKIYDVSTYQVVHTLDVPGSVLSVGVPVSTSWT